VLSDIDGPENFPDGTLNQNFENIAFRLKNTNFQMKSGKGYFQPVALYVKKFEFTRPEYRELKFQIEGEPLSIFNNESKDQFLISFFLWNYQLTLFEKSEKH
jgi:hypothetical protein